MWQVHVTYNNDKWNATEWTDHEAMLRYFRRCLSTGEVKRITCTYYRD